MTNNLTSNKIGNEGSYTTISTMNHKKPDMGVLKVPYITKAPIHDTIEKKKSENKRIIYTINESKYTKRKKRIINSSVILETLAALIGTSFLGVAIFKIIKKLKH